VGTRWGKAIRFDEADIRASGRASMGVRSIRLDKQDEVISLALVEEGGEVLSVSELGFGKRSDLSLFRDQRRGGKGVKTMNLTEKTGPLAALLMVRPDEDIMVITDDGTIIRVPAETIRQTGRAAQGVRIMRVSNGSRIVDVARAMAEEEEDEDMLTPEENGQAAVDEGVLEDMGGQGHDENA